MGDTLGRGLILLTFLFSKQLTKILAQTNEKKWWKKLAAPPLGRAGGLGLGLGPLWLALRFGSRAAAETNPDASLASQSGAPRTLAVLTFLFGGPWRCWQRCQGALAGFRRPWGVDNLGAVGPAKGDLALLVDPLPRG